MIRAQLGHFGIVAPTTGGAGDDNAIVLDLWIPLCIN
jgi:hypothetical protein